MQLGTQAEGLQSAVAGTPVGLGHDAGQEAHSACHHRRGHAGARQRPAAPLDPAAHHIPAVRHHVRLHKCWAPSDWPLLGAQAEARNCRATPEQGCMVRAQLLHTK